MFRIYAHKFVIILDSRNQGIKSTQLYLHVILCRNLSSINDQKQPPGCSKKETMAKVFSCKFCKIFKNTYFTEHLRTTTSE